MMSSVQSCLRNPTRRHGTVKQRLKVAGCVALLAVACGCGGDGSSAEEVATPEPDLWQTPLTIADWKQSSDIEKYSPEVLQRLREHNPELRSNKEWAAFYKEVVAPGFHGDMSRQ